MDEFYELCLAQTIFPLADRLRQEMLKRSVARAQDILNKLYLFAGASLDFARKPILAS